MVNQNLKRRVSWNVTVVIYIGLLVVHNANALYSREIAVDHSMSTENVAS
jgi:hypothetical protein